MAVNILKVYVGILMKQGVKTPATVTTDIPLFPQQEIVFKRQQKAGNYQVLLKQLRNRKSSHHAIRWER